MKYNIPGLVVSPSAELEVPKSHTSETKDDSALKIDEKDAVVPEERKIDEV